jgi:hypothetical protein
MRKLVFALTAASVISFAAPASAQMFYTGYTWGPYIGVGWGPAYPYYDRVYGPWGPAYYQYAVVRRERHVVRYRHTAYSAHAYGPQAYGPQYARVGVGCCPCYGYC